MQKIGASAFERCTNLKEIVWNDKIERIGTYAFYLSGLSGKIDLPESIVFIEFKI